MVDPMSVTIGIGVAVVALLAILGVYLAGFRQARKPDGIVDMGEISNYYRHKNSNQALAQDVEDRPNDKA